jgi:hypothetical protein
MRALSVLYWIPVLAVATYMSFGFNTHKIWGVIILVIMTLISFIVSWKLSELEFNSWYHEILMCGTDKISMSISILSNADQSRSWWMLAFEAYFGILIKFVNPACIIVFIMEGLAADLKQPFGITQGVLPVVASIYVFIAILIIFGPMMMCDYQEMFMHNVEKEFSADDIFETKARIKTKLKSKFVSSMKAGNMGPKATDQSQNSAIELTSKPAEVPAQVAADPATNV